MLFCPLFLCFRTYWSDLPLVGCHRAILCIHQMRWFNVSERNRFRLENRSCFFCCEADWSWTEIVATPTEWREYRSKCFPQALCWHIFQRSIDSSTRYDNLSILDKLTTFLLATERLYKIQEPTRQANRNSKCFLQIASRNRFQVCQQMEPRIQELFFLIPTEHFIFIPFLSGTVMRFRPNPHWKRGDATGHANTNGTFCCEWESPH